MKWKYQEHLLWWKKSQHLTPGCKHRWGCPAFDSGESPRAPWRPLEAMAIPLGQGHISWPGFYSGRREGGREQSCLSLMVCLGSFNFQGRLKTKLVPTMKDGLSAPKSHQTQKLWDTYIHSLPGFSASLQVIFFSVVDC